MASRNLPTKSYAVKTHGGAPAVPHLTPLQQLRRTVLATLLWEDQFYESGASIDARISELAGKVKPEELAALAIEARHAHNLRHVSLKLLVELVKHGSGRMVSETIEKVVSRADELTELLALYWSKGKTPLAKQIKVGLAKAFTKFDEYQLAKYDRARSIRLRDILFLTHAKPKNDQQASVWKRLVENKLQIPDTWEVGLSSGADPKEVFERLLNENNLGYLALLRNLRNMNAAGVDTSLVKNAILARKGGAEKVLPFRFVGAARAAPNFERELDKALLATIDTLPPIAGKTIVLVDVSGSMDSPLSAKSDLTRMDAAATLAAVINAEDLRVFSFSNKTVEVPPRRGMAGVTAIVKSQSHSITRLAEAVAEINKIPHDRLIVITDEQATTAARAKPAVRRAYMINVASAKNGIGYGKPWIHIDGFSENVIRWVHEFEALEKS